MNLCPMTERNYDLYTADEWEFLRDRFRASALNDIELVILGQNAGKKWPFKGSDETPAKYIEFDFEELHSVPGLVGKKSRVKGLMDILRETLAFDDPFGDMADKVEHDGETDVTYERVLDRFGIPHNYPAKFIAFDAEGRSMVRDEGFETLIDVVHYGQTLHYETEGADDLKAFMNSLAHREELGIARYIPYRRGASGLHLAEAIGQIASTIDVSLQIELRSQIGDVISDEEKQRLDRTSTMTLESRLKNALERIDAVADWFAEEARGLQELIEGGGSYERYFIALNDRDLERIALALARIKFGDPRLEKTGLIAKLGGLFGR